MNKKSIIKVLESLILMIPLVIIVAFLIIQNNYLLKIVGEIVLATIATYMFFAGINRLITK